MLLATATPTRGSVAAVDEADFDALYRRYARPFFKIAAARVGPSAAADVVHDTFEVVWRRRADVPDPDGWAPYSFAVLRNQILQASQRRARKHHDHRFAADFDMAAPEITGLAGFESTVADTDVARRVWRGLSQDDQELVLFLTNSELPGIEAANVLGLSHSAYRKRVSRLRSQIERLVQSHTADAGDRTRTNGSAIP